jgi:hypothetical protein
MGEANTTPIVGVSLGHRHEKTAISVVERTYVPTGEAFNARGYRGELEARQAVAVEYRVRHLERHGPPSRYASVARRVPEIADEIGRDFVLVVDVTATGRSAYALLYQELRLALEGTGIRFRHTPITVSGAAGGVSMSPDAGWLVPRRDLISASQILFDEAQLRIAEALELAGALRDELLAFKPVAKKPGDDLEGWREGKDDDLVLAVATSVWAAQRFLRKETSVPAGTLVSGDIAAGGDDAA